MIHPINLLMNAKKPTQDRAPMSASLDSIVELHLLHQTNADS